MAAVRHARPESNPIGEILDRVQAHRPARDLQRDIETSIGFFHRRRLEPATYEQHLRDAHQRRERWARLLDACAEFERELSDVADIVGVTVQGGFEIEWRLKEVASHLATIRRLADETKVAKKGRPIDITRLQLVWDLAATLREAGIGVNASRTGVLHRLLERAGVPRTRCRQRGRNGTLLRPDPATAPDFKKSIAPILELFAQERLLGRARPSWDTSPAIYSSVLINPPIIVAFSYAGRTGEKPCAIPD